jgi:chaperonin GroES
MSINLKPLGGRIVVEPVEAEDITSGGIFLPETAKEKPQKGTILSVGPGERDDKGKYIPMDVKVGDVVLYNKYAGTEIKVDGKKVIILRENEVLAIVENA